MPHPVRGADPGADPLAQILTAAAGGRFPPVDGGLTVLPPDATTGLSAVLSFTGHAVVLADRTPEEVRALGVDGYAGAHDPDTLRGLAGGGWIGVLDAVLVAPGTGVGATLAPTSALDQHPRVAYARDLRADVRVLADERGLVTLGRGLAGRTELGFEVAEGQRGRGHGRALLREALAEVEAGELVYASCAPGNARSLRSLVAVGFTFIGGEVLLRPTGITAKAD